MEGGPLVLSHCSSSISCTNFHRQTLLPCFSSNSSSSSSNTSSNNWHPNNPKPCIRRRKSQLFVSGGRAAPVILKEIETNPSSLPTGEDNDTYTLPRMDKNGRLIVYASCLDGQDPVRLFEKRMNAPKELGYVFDKSSLLRYDHMRFGGPPVTTSTTEEADQLLSELEAESAIVCNRCKLPQCRFTKKLLGAVVEKWDSHVLVINRVAPPHWKHEPAARILEFSILHLAMSEISGLGTRHQIVINEAVDLAKRFCDGSAPRVINGCLRTFVQDQS
ncbi:Transcription antitermination protein NusB [Bienertia sinuspersici]